MAKITLEEFNSFCGPLLSLSREAMDVITPSVWQVPEGYVQRRFQVKGTPVEHIIPDEKKSDLVIYQLHGGAYAFRTNDMYRQVAISYSKAAGGAEVFSIDYGCAPNHLFPSALNESVAVFQWLLEQGYDNKKIVIVGDSAGGNLALATTLYLRDHNMPLPAGIIGISPWASLEDTFETFKTNFESDWVLGKNAPIIFDIVSHPDYAGDTDLKTPYLSPMYGSYENFPPILVQCGDAGILYGCIEQLASKIKEADVDFTYQVYAGQFHDFQLILPTEEDTQTAWAEIGKFLAKFQ